MAKRRIAASTSSPSVAPSEILEWAKSVADTIQFASLPASQALHRIITDQRMADSWEYFSKCAPNKSALIGIGISVVYSVIRSSHKVPRIGPSEIRGHFDAIARASRIIARSLEDLRGEADDMRDVVKLIASAVGRGGGQAAEVSRRAAFLSNLQFEIGLKDDPADIVILLRELALIASERKKAGPRVSAPRKRSGLIMPKTVMVEDLIFATKGFAAKGRAVAIATTVDVALDLGDGNSVDPRQVRQAFS